LIDWSKPYDKHGLRASLHCFPDICAIGAWLFRHKTNIKKHVKLNIRICYMPVVLNG